MGHSLDEISSPLIEQVSQAEYGDSTAHRGRQRLAWKIYGLHVEFWIVILVLFNLVALSVIYHLVLKTDIEVCGGLKTDALFGTIPRKNVVFHQNRTFMDVELYFPPGTPRLSTIWDDLMPSLWVAVPNPAEVGYSGGVKMSDYAEDPSTFEANSEAFTVSAMHQIHCLALIKESFSEYRQTNSCETEMWHLDHCIEYLRQMVMCYGDLTLERPGSIQYPQSVAGGGETHYCRDWDSLIRSVRERGIQPGNTGWISL